MGNIFSCGSKKYKSSAQVVDGKLILSFPDALTPVVWQMDLGQAKASALEVRENKEAKTCTLTLKTPRGETLEIAPFETRQQAVDGLMAAARALESAHGQIHLQAANSQDGAPRRMPGKVKAPRAANDGGGLQRWAAGLLGILLLVVLFGFWGTYVPRAPESIKGGAGGMAAAVDPQKSSGVPVSADDFLSGRQ